MQTKIRSFTDLKAWQEGHKLVLAIYKSTNNLPDVEKFSLITQIQRAAVSITSNIAEGFSRYSAKEQAHFFYIALGSVKEIQNQLLICKDLNYLEADQFKVLANQTVIVSKLLNGLIKSSRNRSNQ